jgi:hypothetical protein
MRVEDGETLPLTTNVFYGSLGKRRLDALGRQWF